MPVPALSLMSTPLIPRRRDAYGIEVKEIVVKGKKILSEKAKIIKKRKRFFRK